MTIIRAVAFDLWGTLIVDTPGSLRRRTELRTERLLVALAGAGYPATSESLLAAYRLGWSRAEESRRPGLDISSRRQVELFLEALQPGLPSRLAAAEIDRIADVYAEALLDLPPPLIPGAAEALDFCRERDVRTALVSNTGQTPGRVLRRALRSLGLAGRIDVWVFSDEIGLSKPAPAIFRHAVSALGVRPEETLFVGDTPDLDVAGARAAGMRILQVGSGNGVSAPPPDLVLPDLRGFARALHAAGFVLAPARGDR